MKNLQQYLQGNLDRNVIDHALRAHSMEDGRIHFYIHPDGVDGDTLDFIVDGNQITSLDNRMEPVEE